MAGSFSRASSGASPASCEQWLDLLWQISWQAAAIVILVLLLQRTLGRAVSHRWRHALWMLVLLRLLLPILPQSRFSIFSVASLLPQATTAPKTLSDPSSQFTTLSLRITASPRSESPLPVEPRAIASMPSTSLGAQSSRLTLVWLTIALALLLFRIVVNLNFHRRLNREDQVVPLRVMLLLEECIPRMRMRRAPSLMLTNLIQAPAVAGLFRSRILLPVSLADELSDDDLKLVLLHELSHVACSDVAMDWLWVTLQSLHWFNPVLWLFAPIRRNDRELARDEMVLSIAGKKLAPRYGQLLIELSQPTRLPIFCAGLIGMLTGKKRLQRRIEMIARFDGTRWYATCAGLILITVAGCCMLTAPRAAPQKKPTSGPAVATTSPSASTSEISDEYADLPEAPISEADRQIMQKLDQHIKPEIPFNANKLTDVFDYLRDTTGTNIYVDWPALERADIPRDAAVTARLHDVRFSKALELIFKSVEGEGDRRLGYTVDEGAITISTRKELDKNTVTRRYDVNDLLFIPADYSNQPDLGKIIDSQGPATRPANVQADRATRIDELKRYVIDNVEPDSWKENGGGTASISSSPLRAVLLITQTPRAHRKIQAVLDDLRHSRSVQVSIESRNICMTDAMESKLPANLRSRLATVRNAGRYRRDQFLTDAELNLLIHAVQDSRIAPVLTAPRLTLFNGQTAVLVVNTQQAYVADMDKVPASSTTASHYEPVIKTTTAIGVTLKVTTCASPDGGSVFVDLHDQIARSALIPERFGKDPAMTVQRRVLHSIKVDAACGIPNTSTLLLSGADEIDSGDPNFNADSPDRPASDAEVKKDREDGHLHEYLLIKPTILVRK